MSEDGDGQQQDTAATTERVAAILAADAVAYSRLMADDEKATIAALDRARAVFAKHIEANQGRVVDTAGDSVLAVFDTTNGAVRASVAIQDELSALNEGVPEPRQMQFRIGIHLGDIHEKADGTVYGDGVNVAARLEGIADPAGIIVSDMVHGAVAGRVNAAFADIGEHEVKNIAKPVQAYRVMAEGAVVPEPSRPRPRFRHLAIVVVILLLGLPAMLWQWWQNPVIEPAPGGPILAMDSGPTIAVLPFDNLSGDPDQEYFADGITDTMITDLSKVRKLGVIASNSTFAYNSPLIKWLCWLSLPDDEWGDECRLAAS